jgi:uncharacterized protein
LAEIEAHKARNAQTEDHILALMEEVDVRSKHLKQEEDKLAKVSAEYAQKRAELEARLAAVKSELTEQTQERARLLSELPREILLSYQRVHKSRKGIAIVLVRDGSCGGCFINLPPQLVAEVRQGEEVMSCEHCGRILIWESA